MPRCRKLHMFLILGCVLAARLPAGAIAQGPLSPPTLLVPSESAIEIQDGPAPVAPGNSWPGVEVPSGPSAFPSLASNDGRGGGDGYTWQILPDGLMYPSYLAGEREPRLESEFLHERTLGGVWDATAGARVGILRYGTEEPGTLPQGVQLDVEGAAFPQLQFNWLRDLDAVDFRFGVPLTMRSGPWETKFAFYHLSSHLGDQYMLLNPDIARVNFSRNCLVWGLAYRPIADVRIYGEVGWAFEYWGNTKQWEFQFGFEYSPTRFSGLHGDPFFAINAHLRQEVNFGGALTVQTGWQWRGATGHLVRVGAIYFNGKSEYYQFGNTFEQQIGGGIWYDF